MQEYIYISNPLVKEIKEIVVKTKNIDARIYTFNTSGEPYVIVFKRVYDKGQPYEPYIQRNHKKHMR
jgi:hypothetical protein